MTVKKGFLMLLLGTVLSSSTLRAEEPRRSAIWESYCSVCHGSDGKSATEEGKMKGARNLADPKWLASVSDSRIESSIRRGRDQMPPFGKKLNNEQIKALVAEVRSLTPR